MPTEERPDVVTVESLIVDSSQAAGIKKEAVDLKSWDLSDRQIWDCELLLSGAFSPLKGYLTEADLAGVMKDMRLENGSLWPIPVTLDVTEEFAASLQPGERVALRHPEGMLLAIITVSDIYTPDRAGEAKAVFGTTDESHPGVNQVLNQTNPVYLGGSLEGVELPPHHTFRHLRHTPSELRAEFKRLGWNRIVAFQTRNPLHRAHVELTRMAQAETGANLLLHPVVGRTSPGDVDYFSRVRCYEGVLAHYPEHSAMLSLLPLAMRMGGPREALWHAIIRRNYGCTPPDRGPRPRRPPQCKG